MQLHMFNVGRYLEVPQEFALFISPHAFPRTPPRTPTTAIPHRPYMNTAPSHTTKKICVSVSYN